MESESVAKIYNKLGTGFDQLVNETPFLINSYLLYDLCLKELTEGKRYGRVLDVGCGSGLQSICLAPHADEVVGIDLSHALIDVAKKRCSAYPNVRFEVADACKLPFPDESFDLIVSYGDVLSHIVEGYPQAVAEMARVAKTGALITLETDSKWNFGIFYHPSELVAAMTAPPGIGHDTRTWEGMRFKTFTYKELTGLLESNHLEVLSCRGHNILTSLIPDLFLLEKKRSRMGKFALAVGKLDLILSGWVGFRRFGFNFVITARKKIG